MISSLSLLTCRICFERSGEAIIIDSIPIDYMNAFCASARRPLSYCVHGIAIPLLFESQPFYFPLAIQSLYAFVYDHRTHALSSSLKFTTYVQQWTGQWKRRKSKIKLPLTTILGRQGELRLLHIDNCLTLGLSVQFMK